MSESKNLQHVYQRYYAATFKVLHAWDSFSYQQATLIIFVLACSYCVARCTYLLRFHPLAKYPGPRLAAVSNVFYAKTWFSGRYPYEIQKLYHQYGPVVRLAPNELLFFNPQAYYDIHDSAVHNRETFIKSNFQILDPKDPGITAETDPEKHRQVSKKLHPAFSSRSLKNLEPVLQTHVDMLIRQISVHGTKKEGIDVKEWMDRYHWDIATDFGYGRHFHQIENNETSETLATFQKVSLLGTIIQVAMRFPLLSPLAWLFVPPSLVRTAPKLLKANLQEVKSRIDRKDHLAHADLIQHLFPKKDEEDMPTDNWFLSQANVLVIAGFDPMTISSTSIFYYLCRFPEAKQRLMEEIRTTFSSYDEIKPAELMGCKYLNAMLYEDLRIHTNAAFGVPRVSPGATVDGQFIPAGVIVQTGHYATTHDEKNFALPYEFHPERHLPDTHPLYDARFRGDNKKAFIPFSMGPRGCPGYHSAFMQARMLWATILWTYDFELLNGDTLDWERDTKMYSMWVLPEVRIRFTKR
ncbi:cytochrome P450 [Xylariaceae sp. FL1019]|nr:cytochrome P450 [Xylariaceae sp. FL1019]